MRKHVFISCLAFILSSLLLCGAASAARLKVFFGQASADFGRTNSYVEVSPVVGAASARCTQTCTVTIPNGTTITLKLSLAPAAEEFTGWVEPLPGQDLNKVCIGGTQPVCTFDTGQDTDYFARPGVNAFTATLQVNFGSGSFRVPASAEIDVQYLEASGAGVLTVPALSDGRRFSFLPGKWRVTAVRAADTECALGAGAGFGGFTVAPSGITNITVPFKPSRCRVIAAVSGAQGGSVSSAPPGITDCRESCAASFPIGSVALTATPDAGFVFQRWSSGETNPSVSFPITNLAVTKTAFFVRPQALGADLQITQSASSLTVAPGTPVTFALTVRNNGPDAATNIAVSNPLPDDFTGVTITPSQNAGECTPNGCNIGRLAGGSSATVTITATAPLGLAQYTNSASVLSQDPDPNTSNNASSLTVNFGSSSGTLAAALGPSNPAPRTVLKGEGAVAMLQFTVTPPAGSSVTDYTLTGLTLRASGTGNDASDLTAVRLYPDNNANGIVDATEQGLAISSGTFTANDGTLSLSFAPTGILAGRTYLVAVDFNSSLASAGFGVTLGSVFVLGLLASRRRFGLCVLALGLVAALCGCPGPTPSAETHTYTLEVMALSVTKSGIAAAVSGLPLEGGTITVQK
jgi:uncharacterized repeat protein (TIGR01451 family)